MRKVGGWLIPGRMGDGEVREGGDLCVRKGLVGGEEGGGGDAGDFDNVM